MAFKKFGNDGDDWVRKVGDLMDQMLNRSYVEFRDVGAWRPAVNVYETDEAFFICMAVAGVEQDQIDVHSPDGRRLVIAGMRGMPRPQGAAGAISIVAMELDQGPFRREVELPELIDVDQIEASYSKGFVWVTVPRTSRTSR